MTFKVPFLSFVILAVILQPGSLLKADEGSRYQAYLQDEQGSSLLIATIKFITTQQGLSYSVTMNEQQFGDYFLAMRPFKCMTDKVNMLCHLAYPYPLERRITASDFTALEHDFLFIRRKPTDYGIDPWNGLYYRIEKKGDEYVGLAHEVDLNILAVPPEEDDPLPLKNAEIHEIDAEQLWLPRLLIKPE